MEARAVSKYVHMSAQKVRLVGDLVRGRSVDEALTVLRFTNKAAAGVLAKTISSAASNAEENLGLSRGDLIVSEVLIDEGPTLRRGRAGARGRYKPLLKRSSHISVTVAERGAA